MVAGHRIDDAAPTAFVEDAAIVIAHNSRFDRKFAERYWPVSEHRAWAWSATEVEGRKHGFAEAQLGYVLNGAGFFHAAHRAVDDCHALLEVLAFELATKGPAALALQLETARKPAVRVWVEQSPFKPKDSLKRRSYKWSGGTRWPTEELVCRRLRDRAAGQDRVSADRLLSGARCHHWTGRPISLD
jgi:DNA polymerase-3 subunit epsilon